MTEGSVRSEDVGNIVETPDWDKIREMFEARSGTRIKVDEDGRYEMALLAVTDDGSSLVTGSLLPVGLAYGFHREACEHFVETFKLKQVIIQVGNAIGADFSDIEEKITKAKENGVPKEEFLKEYMEEKGLSRHMTLFHPNDNKEDDCDEYD